MKFINQLEEYKWLWRGKDNNKRHIIRMSVIEGTILHIVAKKATTRIVEIGRMNGGSTFVLCKSSNVPVISIDLHYKNTQCLNRTEEEFKERLKLINDRSNKVNLQLPYDVILIDGDHSTEGVFNDVKKYWYNISSNGYAIFHDYWTRRGVRRVVDYLIHNNIGTERTFIGEPTTKFCHPEPNLRNDTIVLQKKKNLPVELDMRDIKV